MVRNIVNVAQSQITIYIILRKNLVSADCHSCFQRAKDNLMETRQHYATKMKTKKNSKGHKEKSTCKRRKQRKQDKRRRKNPGAQDVKQYMQKHYISKGNECNDQQQMVLNYMSNYVGYNSRRQVGVKEEIRGTSLEKWSWTYSRDRGPDLSMRLRWEGRSFAARPAPSRVSWF